MAPRNLYDRATNNPRHSPGFAAIQKPRSMRNGTRNGPGQKRVNPTIAYSPHDHPRYPVQNKTPLTHLSLNTTPYWPRTIPPVPPQNRENYSRTLLLSNAGPSNTPTPINRLPNLCPPQKGTAAATSPCLPHKHHNPYPQRCGNHAQIYHRYKDRPQGMGQHAN